MPWSSHLAAEGGEEQAWSPWTFQWGLPEQGASQTNGHATASSRRALKGVEAWLTSLGSDTACYPFPFSGSPMTWSFGQKIQALMSPEWGHSVRSGPGGQDTGALEVLSEPAGEAWLALSDAPEKLRDSPGG